MSVVGTQLRDSGRAFGDVFRNRELRRINLAFAGSIIGDWAYAVAVSIWAYQQGGATALGVYGVARFVVMMVASPIMSTLADRLDKKHLMIASDVIRVVLVTTAAAMLAADAPAAFVYGLALTSAIVGGAFRPAQASLLPRLASDPKELTGANVVSSTIESIGFFAGPAIGALLLALADIPVVFLFNAATFLWSAVMLVGLRVPAASPDESDAAAGDASDEIADAVADSVVAVHADGSAVTLAEPVVEVPAKTGFMAELTAGFRTVLEIRELRLICALCAAQTVVAGASLVFEVSIALELLGLGESGVGLLNSVLGIGGLVGGLVVMVLAMRGRLATDFGIGVVLWSAPLLLVVVSPTVAAAVAAMFLIGLANSLVDINLFTIVQRITPPEVMGRVFGAIESVFIAGMALGALLMPLLINTVGLRAGLAIIGASVALVALSAFGALARIDKTLLAPPSLSLLRTVPMFAVLPAPALERLAQSLAEVRIPAGEPVFREGDRGDQYYVIESGGASVWMDGEHVRDLGPGDGFGEIALLRDVPRTATVLAADDELVLQALDRDVFIPAVTGYGEASEVADAVVERWLALT